MRLGVPLCVRGESEVFRVRIRIRERARARHPPFSYRTRVRVRIASSSRARGSDNTPSFIGVADVSSLTINRGLTILGFVLNTNRSWYLRGQCLIFCGGGSWDLALFAALFAFLSC